MGSGSEGIVREKTKKDPEPTYLLVSSKTNTAHGACDPQAIFEVRTSIEQVKADVAAHVCIEPYKAADNALLDLQDGFDKKGVAKCGNDDWIRAARLKIFAFRNCIRDEVRAAPYVRPETKNDLSYKMRDLFYTYRSRLVFTGKRKGKHYALTPAAQKEEDIIKMAEEEEEDPRDDLPEEVHVHPKRAGHRRGQLKSLSDRSSNMMRSTDVRLGRTRARLPGPSPAPHAL